MYISLRHLAKYIIVGVVIGLIILAIIAAIIFLVVYHRRTKQKSKKSAKIISFLYFYFNIESDACFFSSSFVQTKFSKTRFFSETTFSQTRFFTKTRCIVNFIFLFCLLYTILHLIKKKTFVGNLWLNKTNLQVFLNLSGTVYFWDIIRFAHDVMKLHSKT